MTEFSKESVIAYSVIATFTSILLVALWIGFNGFK